MSATLDAHMDEDDWRDLFAQHMEDVAFEAAAKAEHAQYLRDVANGEWTDYVHDPDDTDRPGHDTHTNTQRNGA